MLRTAFTTAFQQGNIPAGFSLRLEGNYIVLTGANNTGKTSLLKLLFRENAKAQAEGKTPLCFLLERSSIDLPAQPKAETLEQYNIALANGLAGKKATHSSNPWLLPKLLLEHDDFTKQMKRLASYLEYCYLPNFDLQGTNEEIYNHLQSTFDRPGLRHIITMLAALTDDHIKMLLIDEPDIYLHPRVQKLLKYLFYARAIDKQIIVTTHSSFLLNAEDYKCNYIIGGDHTQFGIVRVSSRSQLESMMPRSEVGEIIFPDSIDFLAMKGLFFKDFVRDLLLDLGYKVVVEPEEKHSGYDFQATYPSAPPQSTPREHSVIVQVKFRNVDGQLDKATLSQLVKRALMLKADKVLFITNVVLTAQQKKVTAKGINLEIWDATTLLALLERFPGLKEKYFGAVPQPENVADDSERADRTHDTQHPLIEELMNLPTGDGAAHQKLMKKILEFCFQDEFSPFQVKEQVETDDKKRRRDFIIDNRSPKTEFWRDLKLTNKVQKILFDAKNYKDPLEYRDISDTLRYLENEAFGNFIIIVSRRGVKDYTEALDSYTKSGRITLFLTDDDVIMMINLKIEGRSPTLLIEDKYYDFLDKK